MVTAEWMKTQQAQLSHSCSSDSPEGEWRPGRWNAGSWWGPSSTRRRGRRTRPCSTRSRPAGWTRRSSGWAWCRSPPLQRGECPGGEKTLSDASKCNFTYVDLGTHKINVQLTTLLVEPTTLTPFLKGFFSFISATYQDFTWFSAMKVCAASILNSPCPFSPGSI